jgi:hypothetical protein
VSGQGSNKGTGVYGFAENGIGVNGYGGANGQGVYGASTNGYGVNGVSVNWNGVHGTGLNGLYGEGSQTGVYGKGRTYGIWGEGSSGVRGDSTSKDGIGVIGTNSSGGEAGRFDGLVRVNGALLVTNGCSGCNPPSDRNLKANFSFVNPHSVLTRLISIPIQSWNYKSEADSIRHLGPTAQDFRMAFGLGDSEKTLNMVDANGVALTAIQALYRMMQEKDRKIEQLQNRLSRLELVVHMRAGRGSQRRR